MLSLAATAPFIAAFPTSKPIVSLQAFNAGGVFLHPNARG
jgi:hypothetical protein